MDNHHRPPRASLRRSRAASLDRDGVPERERAAHRRTRSANHGGPIAGEISDPAANGGARSKPERSRFASLAPVLLSAILLCVGATLLAQPNGGAPSSVAPNDPSTYAFDPGSLLIRMGLVLLLIFVNAFFAIAEIALITVRKTRIAQLKEEGNKQAEMVERLLAHPTRMMATIQTSVTLIATFSSAIAATSAIDPLSHWLRIHGSGPIATYAGSIALLAVELPVAILMLVIGEIAPKSLAVRHTEQLALITVGPVRALQTLLQPVVSFLTVLSNIVVRPFGGTASFSTSIVNEEELKMLVESSEEQGVLNAEETEMIHSILDFGDTVVRKVMTPRLDMTALSVEAPADEIVHVINESGHSRIPVFEGDLDNIVGIVHAKDLLRQAPGRDLPSSIREVMRPPYFIPETKRIGDLLKDLRRKRQQLAIVRDEYGVTAGVITIEDLVEEIVGDIQDEYDTDEPALLVIDQHTTVLNGLTPLDDINDRMALDLPEDVADTIGGFVFSLLGHAAAQGERAYWNGIEFVVEATDGRRITKVRVVRNRQSRGGAGPTPQSSADPARPEQHNGDSYRNGALEISGVETSPDITLRQ